MNIRYNKDGELDRHWISANEDPQDARSHPYSILTFLNASRGKVYRDNEDFGFSTTADRDYFGSKTSLPSRQRLLGQNIAWETMKRQYDETEASRLIQRRIMPNRSFKNKDSMKQNILFAIPAMIVASVNF